ncbi:MAG: YbfB/YjiJ family MFS transporter [Anaerolineae bacterium]
MTVETTTSRRLHYAWVILVAAVATVFASLGLGRFGYTMILPNMRQGLQFSYTQMGALATGNFVGYLVFALLGGYLASRFGPRVVIAISLVFAGAAMLLTGLASGFAVALIGRTLTGLGSGGSNVPVMGLISAWFGRRLRGMAAGIAVGGSGIGLMATGWLVPRIMASSPESGWRISWYVLGGIVVLFGVAAWLILRDRPAAMGLRAIGDDGPVQAGSSDPEPEHPPLRKMYTSPLLIQLGLIYAAFGFSYIIYATFFAAYLTEERGLSGSQAGAMWSLVGVLAIFCGFVWGALSDRIGRRAGLALVFALEGVAILLLALWTAPVGYTVSAFLFGFSAFAIPAIMAAACGDFVGPRMAPAALGAITLVFGIGQSIGPSVGGWLADQSGSFATAFVVAAVAAFLGSAGAVALRQQEVWL